MTPGDLVVLPRERELGVGRLERCLEAEGRRYVRVLLYEDGALVVRPLEEVVPCPPGVWRDVAKEP
jgi:hypothetical protein